MNEYQSARLRIMMNRAYGDIEMNVHVNEHYVPIAQYEISSLPEWFDIPIDMNLLYGQSHVTVYLRVMPSQFGGALEIWGDEDTPTRDSLSNFQEVKDLSSDNGRQEGEYLIRLLLEKP